jgi:hypothetical protein
VVCGCGCSGRVVGGGGGGGIEVVVSGVGVVDDVWSWVG